MFGWIDTKVYDETHDEQKAAGWCGQVLDTNGDGKITKPWNMPAGRGADSQLYQGDTATGGAAGRGAGARGGGPAVDPKLDTMVTVGHVMQAVREWRVDEVYVDVIGVGAGVYDRLCELQREGKIRQIGVCNVDEHQLGRARATARVVSVQNRYSLAERGSPGVLERCERDGLAFLPWFPLATGDLAKPGGVLDEVASRLGVPPSQVALAWLLHHSPVGLPIPGTSIQRPPTWKRSVRSVSTTPSGVSARWCSTQSTSLAMPRKPWRTARIAVVPCTGGSGMLW